MGCGSCLTQSGESGSRTRQGGPLDESSSAAFRIWLKLVHYLSGKEQEFKLVVAGGWAVFQNEFEGKRDGSLDLKEYLALWIDWT